MKLKPLILGSLLLMGPMVSMAEASMTLECETKRYNLSTGTDQGACAKEFGDQVSMSCSDNDGNTASADCKNGCGETLNKGTCQEEEIPQGTTPEATTPEGTTPESTVPESTTPESTQ